MGQASQPRRRASRPFLIGLPVLAFVIGVTLTAVAVWQSRSDVGSERDRIAVERTITGIKTAMDGHGEVLVGLRALFGAATTVEQGGFAAFIEQGDYDERFPGVFAVEWAPRVQEGDLGAFEATLRREARRADGSDRRAYRVFPNSGRVERFPVEFLHPRDPDLLGLDLAFEPANHRAIVAARDSGRRQAGAPIELVQGGRGLLIFEAVTSPEVAAAGCTDAPSKRCVRMRRDGLRGVLSTVSHVEQTIGGLQADGTTFSIIDRGPLGEPPGRAEPVFLAAAAAESSRASVDIEVFGRRWEVVFHSLGEVPVPGTPPALIAVLGLAISLVLAGAVYLSTAFGRRYARLSTDLAASNEQLRATNEDLEQFAFVASHDLQTPIRNVRQLADAISEDVRSGDYSELDGYADLLDSAGERAEALIGSLLGLSRARTSEIGLEVVETARLVEEIGDELKAEIDAVEGTLTVSSPPDLWADRTLIRQALVNLIANGFKYRYPGRPPQVRVWGELDDEWATVHVEDNGIGIPGEYRAKVFEPFRRLHTQEQIPGSGIGLALARRVVLRHEGEIWAESEPDSGSTFSFRLPRGPQGGAAPSAGASEASARRPVGDIA